MSSNINSPANSISTLNPLGIFSKASPEIRDMIWSHLLRDITITYSIWTRSFTWSPSPILRTSSYIQSEVIGASKLHGIHTFPGAWHLENYLAHVWDTTTIPQHIRLRFNSPNFFPYSSSPVRYHMIRRAIEGRLREWGELIEALLREGFRRRTLILDITDALVVPDINDNDIYMQEFGRFIRLLMAVRESMSVARSRSARRQCGYFDGVAVQL
ncbi:hypothetical protein HBH53_034880 [Parastagonospora nodorum]|nr:hypothetical protein HBH53_034880 [Parastagonospora nodorum]KAH3984338.1 hypothetical protein HBH51_025010 [Parastagonospora nodorum]KAH5705190.1 hypothetical protein HBI20_236490 [Parastagonospora nodorum]KAH6064991.1 hypothetical protein HBI66_167040 [Parastagonospora nodorum]KAH6069262.1 hypothetical protein HBI67_093330 [Parastagonospora nodorum]